MNRRPVPIKRTNATVDGSRWRVDTWAQLDFTRAWIDPGTGGGPYLKVPMVHRDAMGRWVDETVHRVRPVARLGVRYPAPAWLDPWKWSPAASLEDAVMMARAAEGDAWLRQRRSGCARPDRDVLY